MPVTEIAICAAESLSAPFRHFRRHLFGHRAVVPERRLRDAQHLDLGGVGIGHEPRSSALDDPGTSVIAAAIMPPVQLSAVASIQSGGPAPR
jgi:hypothetical protein